MVAPGILVKRDRRKEAELKPEKGLVTQRGAKTGAVAVVFALAILTGGCTSASSSPSRALPPSSRARPASTSTSTSRATTGNKPARAVLLNAKGPAPRLFDVTLSKGDVPVVATVSDAVETGDPLADGRRAELIGKLPKWEDPTTLTTPFAWPTQSPPPPRTGATVNQPFPPAATADPPAVDNGPLKVLRVQPEGDVPIAPYLAVTFNQPMVAVGTVAQVTPADSPVKLTPAIAGHWQWIGTRTLRFDADSATVDRLPMATRFTATVPAGTKSAAGGSLATAATFTFTTPAPVARTFDPQQNENIDLQPVFVATFDQRVDPAAVLATVKLTANVAVPIRLATKAEIAADENAKNLVGAAEDGRWVAFRPARPMPTETAFTVDIGPRTPSAEGPITTVAAQSYTGRTYGPLKVQRAYCAYGDPCPPGSPLYVEFTNPLDEKAGGTTDAKITVSPKLQAETITVNQGVQIEGATQARTTYSITLPGSLTDIHGQKLGSDATVNVPIGSARPSLRQLDGITTLDPFSKSQKLSVLTVNHPELRVRVFEADPAVFSTYLRYSQSRYDNNTRLPNWKVLSDSQVKTSGEPDATVETQIDLSRELGGRPGQVIVLVEAVPAPAPGTDAYYENIPILSWVQSTSMALDAFTDGAKIRVWATDLRTGAPVNGLAVTPWSQSAAAGPSATTDDTGVAVLPLPSDSQVTYVQGRRATESFILPVNAMLNPSPDTFRWYAFDDRQIYRPGETLRLKGWVRQVNGTTSALTVVPLKDANYVVNDAFGVELTKGTLTLGALGGFDLNIGIPATANTGPANISFTSPTEARSPGFHQFQIAEFRRPEFEVKVEPVTSTPFVSTKPVTMSAEADYYAGGPLPNSPVAWTVSTSETNFSPVGWDDFTFGIFRPWWLVEDFGPVGRSFPNPGSQQVKQYTGTTDANGRDALRLDFSTPTGTLPDLPVSVAVSGTVTDVNRQAWSDRRNILVHSADRYVGLRSDRPFVRQGDPLNIQAIVTDVDGKAQPGTKLTVTAGVLRTNYTTGKAVETVVDPQTCNVMSATQPSTCEFKTPVGGQYKVTSTVTDSGGGRNRTELSVWVSGATSQPARTVDQEALTLVPDKKAYAAGDTAKLLVQAPFVKGVGLLVVTHGNGVRETQRFSATDGTAEIQMPISESDVPGLAVTVEVVGAGDRVGFDGKKIAGTPQRPAYAVGALTLSVPPLRRTLKVTAKPADTELLPGGKTSIAVTVNDATGSPVKDAEFAVVVVDEAVLGLTGYQLPDPIDIFYGAPYSSLQTQFGRNQVQLVDPETLLGVSAQQPVAVAAETTAAAAAESDQLAGGGASTTAAPAVAAAPSAKAVSRAPVFTGPDNAAPISVRSNFDALALFQPTVVTDAAGRASVDVTVPDNLTRYRVMVVGVSGNERFGTAESNITARLPLAVRPSAPRFLNTGDAFELPVVLQNITREPRAVDVVVQLANLDATGPLGRHVDVPAGDRIEVRFPVKVRSAGTARARVSGFAASGTPGATSATDSAEVSIPVYTPGTAEAFATYGTIDSGAVRQPVLAPTNVIDSYGSLDISTSSTSLQALTDALLYVNDYDFQSSDAYASRIMSISALRGVLKDFATEGLPTEAELNAAVDRDIAGLVALQNDDGGWSYWRRFQRSEPYNSVQATHALVLARLAGYIVSPNAIARALSYTANIEQFIPADYGDNYRDVVRSYALWVSALAGQRNPTKAAAFFTERGDKLNLDALAWIWGSLDNPAAKASIERTITNRAVDTAGAVSFTSGYTDSDYLTLGSDRRTDAIVLDSLIANAPKSDLIPKVVAGLLGHKTKGRWNNMQENSFALLALKRYYDTYESVTPDFVARAWLGPQFAGERSFKGRSTDRSLISVPMKALIDGGNRDLVLAKDGVGRLYYRIGLRYVPADLILKPLDRGFVVNRLYEGVDNKSDVTRDADGIWHVRAGAKVRVRLTMVAESQRTFVALIDALPAGFEALNPTLAVTEAVVEPTVGGQPSASAKIWWWGAWYQFQQFRDDRSEAFTTYLPAGVYDYSYVARATTPGSFVVPPTRAEEMYAPETFGRAATDRVVVG
jgi:alpha-2-macroglobulin